MIRDTAVRQARLPAGQYAVLLRGMMDHARRRPASQQVEQSADLISAHRPDIIGATRAIDDEGYVTETVAFTSEADAREGERKEPPPELKQLLDGEMSMLEDIRFLELHQPWFASRR